MKSIKMTGIPRDGDDQFLKIDLKTYMQRTFSMFHGEKEHLVLRFRMSLLDTVIERFGRTNVTYTKSDEHHFNISVDIEISDQFFGWLCGFGQGVQIVAPQEIKNKYTNYLRSIISRYED